MNKKIIRRNFIGAIVLIMLLLIIIPVITLYMLTQEYDQRIRTETAEASTSIRQTVRAFMDGAYNLSYELAVNPVILTMDGELQAPILADCVSRNEYLELLFIQGTDGMQTARSGGELGYRGGRAWFIETMEHQKPHVYQSYYSIATGMPVTSVFIPMFRDSEIVGIFGADISLNYFQQLAMQFLNEQQGRLSFIIDGEGVVVAHPDITLLETITNFKTQTCIVPLFDEDGNNILNPDGSVVTEEREITLTEGYKNVIDAVMAGNRGMEIIQSEGKTYYASYESIAMPGYSDPWSVITLQDREIAMGAIYLLTFRVIGIIILIFIVFIVIAFGFFMSLGNTLDHLDNARKEAVEANKSKSAFLSTMSHEIRTPMNAILGITEILLQRDDLHEDVKTSLERTYSSGNMLLNIINDILDLSKIEAGKLELVEGKYEVASIISDAAQLNIMRIGSKPIEFELSADENLPVELIGDELRVKQILNNLLSNAFKYTDAGKVEMTVSAKPAGKRWKKQGEEGRYGFSVIDAEADDLLEITFKISDTGQGMTQEQVSELFNEYTRFNMAANRKTEGTGLGLSITHKLVQMMDGEINVESEPGKGTVFTVSIKQVMVNSAVIGKEIADNLRRFRESSRAHIKRIQIKREPMPYGSVLIVDDVETNIFVAEGLLAPYELKIDSAESGAAAINKIKSGKVYDVVFMDHMMPEMDGIEATKLIRETGYKHPIVALTANAVSGQAEMFLSNGFDDFISKPIDMRQMNTILNRLVRDRHKNKNKTETAGGAAKEDSTGEAKAKTRSYTNNPRIMEAFLRDAGKTIAILEEIAGKDGQLDDSDIQLFTINVHGLKSVLDIVGKPEMSETARELEILGREENAAAIAERVVPFLNELRALAEQIEKSQKKNERGS